MIQAINFTPSKSWNKMDFTRIRIEEEIQPTLERPLLLGYTLSLAYAVTISKMQGRNLEAVLVDPDLVARGLACVAGLIPRAAALKGRPQNPGGSRAPGFLHGSG